MPAGVSVLLLLALNPSNPYGYYVLLRWVCCPAFAFLAVRAYQRGKMPWVWVLGVTAAIYNPVLRVHMDREIWSVVNVTTIAIAVASFWGLKRDR